MHIALHKLKIPGSLEGGEEKSWRMLSSSSWDSLPLTRENVEYYTKSSGQSPCGVMDYERFESGEDRNSRRASTPRIPIPVDPQAFLLSSMEARYMMNYDDPRVLEMLALIKGPSFMQQSLYGKSLNDAETGRLTSTDSQRTDFEYYDPDEDDDGSSATFDDRHQIDLEYNDDKEDSLQTDEELEDAIFSMDL